METILLVIACLVVFYFVFIISISRTQKPNKIRIVRDGKNWVLMVKEDGEWKSIVESISMNEIYDYLETTKVEYGEY